MEYEWNEFKLSRAKSKCWWYFRIKSSSVKRTRLKKNKKNGIIKFNIKNISLLLGKRKCV